MLITVLYCRPWQDDRSDTKGIWIRSKLLSSHLERAINELMLLLLSPIR